MKYNDVFIIFILSISNPLFCADQIREMCVNQNGEFTLKIKVLDSNDLSKMTNLMMTINQKSTLDQETLHIYAQNLARIPTTNNIIISLIQGIMFKDPKCAEDMLRNFVSIDIDASEYAFMLCNIGSAYKLRNNYEKAIDLYFESIEIVPSVCAMTNLAMEYGREGDLKAAAYWIAQNKKRGFHEDFLIPKAFDTLCDLINKFPDQKTDFKDDIASILQNESARLYD